MAAAMEDIIDGLVTRIEPVPIPLSDTTMVGRVFPYVSGTQEAPACIIIPGTFIPGDTKAAITYDRTMAHGAHDYVFTLQLVVSRVHDETAARQLYAFLSTDTPQSIKAAIEVDDTLGGLVSFTNVNRVIQYGALSFNEVSFFGAQIIVEVTA